MLDDCEIKDLSVIKYLVQLQSLNISNRHTMYSQSQYKSNLKDISKLQYLVNLKILDLSGNNQIDITPLQYLIQLTTLYLSFCGLHEISALRPLNNLEQLYLDNNNIIKLYPVSQYNENTLLKLANNKITLTEANMLSSSLTQFLGEQQIPSQEELQNANKMNIIAIGIQSIRKVHQAYKVFQFVNSEMLNKSSSSMLKLISDQQQFMKNVVSLFQQLNNISDLVKQTISDLQ
ncbi:leucine-rich_repeat domain-containing protein [Hexamita inflata]|uniref:Leucine-rich repeat domain-containing protein n=1 Tax=Hexamita inflata TaxID=28002 RepID=A0AA86UXH1_9EUKA|nr:leucine-rich repeat domain-containing protein [Hexamita inflata]